MLKLSLLESIFIFLLSMQLIVTVKERDDYKIKVDQYNKSSWNIQKLEVAKLQCDPYTATTTPTWEQCLYSKIGTK